MRPIHIIYEVQSCRRQIARRCSTASNWIAAGLVLLAGCSDLPTETSSDTRPRSSASQGMRLGTEPYSCTIFQRSADSSMPWRHTPLQLHFPRPEIHPSARTVRYVYQEIGSDSRIASAAHCVVPYTETALRRIDRHFGVRTGGAADQFIARENQISLQGCVSEGACVIEGLIVIGYRSGGSGGVGGGGSGDKVEDCSPEITSVRKDGIVTIQEYCPGGGGGPSYPGGGEVPPPGIELIEMGSDVPPGWDMPNCDTPENPMEAGWCAGSDPAGALLQKIQESIDRIDARGGACSAIASHARLLLSMRGFRVTPNDYPGWAAAAPLGGQWVVFESHVFQNTNTIIDYVIAHEMDHSLYEVYAGVTNSEGHLITSSGTIDAANTVHSAQCSGAAPPSV